MIYSKQDYLKEKILAGTPYCIGCDKTLVREDYSEYHMWPECDQCIRKRLGLKEFQWK